MTLRLMSFLAALVVALAACSSSSSDSDSEAAGTAASPDASPTASPTSTDSDASPEPDGASESATEPVGEFVCGDQERPAGGGTWFLDTVRTGTHTEAASGDAFDRVVFELDAGDGASGDPGVVVREATPPFVESGSGNPVDVGADRALQVTLLNTTGVDLSETPPSVVYDGPKELTVSGAGPVVLVVEAGDFEATMNWYIGVDEASCAALATLNDPKRVVVDVRPAG